MTLDSILIAVAAPVALHHEPGQPDDPPER